MRDAPRQGFPPPPPASRSMNRLVSSSMIVGWVESVDLPEWGIRGLLAKVDTGARTSSIHAEAIHECGNGQIAFEVILDPRGRRRVQVTARVVSRRRVRTSSGRAQRRLIVATRLRIGNIEREVEVGLANRSKMTYRMLLGRTALPESVLIDASRKRSVPAEGSTSG